MADTTTTTPTLTQEFPVEYLTTIDKVVELESFTTKYNAKDVRFLRGRTVEVPTIHFDGGTTDYNRFKNESKLTTTYEAYSLERDREKTFYVDAVDNIDDANIQTTNAVIEFERLYFIPEIDKYFFANVGLKAKTKATTTLSKSNIKAELRKARFQMIQNGFASADLYMSADSLAFLEDAIDRQFAGEGSITDMVGHYDIFNVHLVPDSRLAGLDFAAIADGCIQNIMKRATTYMFAPGQHTEGDGYLTQMRWVYGNVALNGKRGGMYVNGTVESGICSGVNDPLGQTTSTTTPSTGGSGGSGTGTTDGDTGGGK